MVYEKWQLFEKAAEVQQVFRNFNIFSKVIILILAMIIPLILLYASSNRVFTSVVESELNKSNMNQLVFFQSQVDTNINRLSLFPNILVRDPDVMSQQDVFLQSEILQLDEITVTKQIQDKLSILSNSTDWQNQLSVYSPSVNQVVSTDPSATYTELPLKSNLQPGWSARKNNLEDSQYDFHWFSVTPYSAYKNPKTAKLIVEVKFSSNNIKDMLDEYDQGGGGHDPFYLAEGGEVLYNSSANKPIVQKVIKRLESEQLSNTGQRISDDR